MTLSREGGKDDSSEHTFLQGNTELSFSNLEHENIYFARKDMIGN